MTWAAAGNAKTEGDIVQKVITLVLAADVELKPRNIKVTHSGENLTIAASWTHDVEFPGYVYPLDFQVKLSEIKRWGRGGLVLR